MSNQSPEVVLIGGPAAGRKIPTPSGNMITIVEPFVSRDGTKFDGSIYGELHFSCDGELVRVWSHTAMSPRDVLSELLRGYRP